MLPSMALRKLDMYRESIRRRRMWQVLWKSSGCSFYLFKKLQLPKKTMVRLITHNLLACHVRGCTSNNFPLIFKDVQLELRESEYNPDFLRGFMPKLEWQALVDTAKSVSSTLLLMHTIQ